MEAKACEKLCPDCPRRNGIARVTGKLTMWWVRKTLYAHKIDRGDCVGTVPLYGGAPNGTAYSMDTGESRRDELWVRSCPETISASTGRAAPEQIVRIFAANPHIGVYVNRIIEQEPQQVATVEQQPQI